MSTNCKRCGHETTDGDLYCDDCVADTLDLYPLIVFDDMNKRVHACSGDQQLVKTLKLLKLTGNRSIHLILSSEKEIEKLNEAVNS